MFIEFPLSTTTTTTTISKETERVRGGERERKEIEYG